MKIVADENILFVEDYFQGDILGKPGRSIVQHDLIDADILLIRSVTKVNSALLNNTSVKFVGSVTAGFDHLDVDWLNKAGIQWNITKGSNAIAVAEYVICVIAALQKMHFLTQKKPRAAVIGVGNIGAHVAEKLKILDFEVVLCDPFRKDIVTTPFEELVDLDFISLHTPLTMQGIYPTHHLVQRDFLSRQKKDCVLLNAGRGEVICFDDLKLYGQSLLWCLDVWAKEPYIDLEILKLAAIATPHIAGYSVQSKYRGVEMIYQAALREKMIIPHASVVPVYPTQTISFEHTKTHWRDVVLRVFDPMMTSQYMKKTVVEDTDAFDYLRKTFPARYEFAYVQLQDLILSEHDRSLLKNLGFFLKSK